MMWTVDQDRDLRIYFTKERLIKQSADDPALKDTLQALIYEPRALSQQLDGGETKKVLANIREQRGSIAGVRNHGVVSSREKGTQSIHTKEMHPKRINANATPEKATRNQPSTGEPVKSENLRDLGLFMEFMEWNKRS
ncbi:hypothetical protein EYC80_005781 [Monilinia laxa]|uniref:Uncharacterized protein n=1 Tax=Monilinia laxa TaxID=61186 RepID=A0A5N6KF82_MONLA|nr:hypothetical protein EYC80_005781 [Monilinia laxa]